MTTTAFIVDNIWYEMDYAIVCKVRLAIGSDPTNRQILDYIRGHLIEYDMVGERSEDNLIVKVTER